MVGQCSGGAQKPFVKSVDFHGELLTIEVLGQDSSVVCTSVALESRLAKWDNHNLTLQIYENASFGHDLSVASESRVATWDNDNLTLQIYENASFGEDQSAFPCEIVRYVFEKCVDSNPEFLFIGVFEADVKRFCAFGVVSS